jgi:thiol-disulfide isomerase/thioredoxin
MRSLLTRLATATLLTIGLAAASGAQTQGSLPAVGSLAPDFTLKSPDGKLSHSLSALQGKVVYLDFWASWCGPCRKAFPEVKALYEEYRERGFVVLAVSLDRSPEAAIRFFEQQKAPFLSAYDAGGLVARKYGVTGIPASIIIGPDGKIIYTATGFDPKNLPALKTLIEAQLAKAKAAPAAGGVETKARS